MKVLLLIAAAVTAAAAASLLDHSQSAAAESSKQQRQLPNPQLLMKRQQCETAGTEETELKQLSKRWGSRFSRPKARSRSHGVAAANERQARDYADFDRGEDLDFGDFTDTADVDYQQTRELEASPQQHHKLASRDYEFLFGSSPAQQQQKRQHKLVSRDYGTLLGHYPGKHQQQQHQLISRDYVNLFGQYPGKQQHQLVSRDYGTLLGAYPVKQQRKSHELASRDYFGILGSTVERTSSVEQKRKRSSSAAGMKTPVLRKSAPEERDYMGMLDDGDMKRGEARASRDYMGMLDDGDMKRGEASERASRDYLDIVLGGGYGQTYNNDPYETLPYGK